MKVTVLVTALTFAVRSSQGDTSSESISFSQQIAPVLVAKCAICHNLEKAKGGFRLHTFEAMTQAGKSKLPSIVPGKPEQSELFKRITATDDDDRMPQKD